MASGEATGCVESDSGALSAASVDSTRGGKGMFRLLKASTAAGAGLLVTGVRAAAPEPTAITPTLVEAARKEGQVRYYTSVDLPLAEKIAKSFESNFPGIAVRTERSGI